MNELFTNQVYGKRVLKHKTLPIFKTNEFNFYRCISFEEKFYGKTVSDLHSGNLRQNKPGDRYSKLFPEKKVSYWADSPQTARSEMKYHNPNNNILTFWAYDDATSTFPTIENMEQLIIINGLETGFYNILDKVETGKELTSCEKDLIQGIEEQNPDCLVYESLRKKGGLNYLFFESGFKKLSIREVRLRLGNRLGKNNNRIVCAGTCDYSPYLESYGNFFIPLTKIGEDEKYKQSEEYLVRNQVYRYSLEKYRK